MSINSIFAKITGGKLNVKPSKTKHRYDTCKLSTKQIAELAEEHGLKIVDSGIGRGNRSVVAPDGTWINFKYGYDYCSNNSELLQTIKGYIRDNEN